MFHVGEDDLPTVLAQATQAPTELPTRLESLQPVPGPVQPEPTPQGDSIPRESSARNASGRFTAMLAIIGVIVLVSGLGWWFTLKNQTEPQAVVSSAASLEVSLLSDDEELTSARQAAEAAAQGGRA